jgi:Flp pilus assembly protein TadD
LLEASERDSDAASVYSETAIAQLKNNLYDDALRTLRRLDRLNESNTGQFDMELGKALEFIRRQP